MQTQFINITVFDQTTRRSRTLSVQTNKKLSEFREIIQKQLDVKDFRFMNDGVICIKGAEKHVPIQTYLKAYNTLTIATQRQQPKKQSKIIQKPNKKQQVTIRHNMAPRQLQQRRQSKFLSNQQILNEKHFKWTRQNIQYCSFKYGIQLSKDGYGLDHDYTAIDMEQFTKYDWGNIEWLGLYGCGIDDKSWRLLVEKAVLFPHLKILGVKDNRITTVKQGDLQAFKSLRMVQFGTISGANPLSRESKQYLKKFKDQNKHIRVKFQA